MVTLTPAYGRDYKTAKAAEVAFTSGKDWVVADIMHPFAGRYCSLRDFVKSGETVKLRFNKNRSFKVIEYDTMSLGSKS